MLKRVLAVLFLLACQAAAFCGDGDVYIGVSAKLASGEKIRIAAEKFLPDNPQNHKDAELAQTLYDVVRADLLFSRYFDVLDDSSAKADEKDLFKRWAGAKSDYILQGKIGITPDNKWLATVRVYDSADKNVVMAKAFKGEMAGIRAGAHRFSDEIVWRITGKQGIASTKIAFSNNSTGNKEIFLVDYDGAGLRQLTSDKSISLLPRWAKDSSRLYYITYRYGNPDTFEIDLVQKKIRPFSLFQGLNIPGGVSPDSKNIVMTLSRGRDPRIYMMDTATKSARRITSGGDGVDSSASYSPDGRYITFISDRSGNPEVYIMELESGKTQRLTRMNWCDSPKWSPTGEWIVFAGRNTAQEDINIYLVDITGSQLRRLTKDSSKNEDPSWSPDGRFIAFTSTRNGMRQIYVMDVDGSAPHLISKLPGQCFTPEWSPK